MRLARRLLAGLLIGLTLTAAVRAGNALENGGFTEPIDVGWAQKATAYDAETFIVTSEPNWVTVRQSGAGYNQLSQSVDVVGLDLKLSFSARLRASVNKPGYGAAAGVMVSYLAADQSLLGRTVFRYAAGLKPGDDWKANHIIPVKPGEKWQEFELNLKDDVAEFHSDIAAADIARVEIALVTDNGIVEGC